MTRRGGAGPGTLAERGRVDTCPYRGRDCRATPAAGSPAHGWAAPFGVMIGLSEFYDNASPSEYRRGLASA